MIDVTELDDSDLKALAAQVKTEMEERKEARSERTKALRKIKPLIPQQIRDTWIVYDKDDDTWTVPVDEDAEIEVQIEYMDGDRFDVNLIAMSGITHWVLNSDTVVEHFVNVATALIAMQDAEAKLMEDEFEND